MREKHLAPIGVLPTVRRRASKFVRVRILPSALRHGIAENDVLHAYRNAISSSPLSDGRLILVGPRRDAQLCEIGVRYDPRNRTVLIFHAMLARPKW